MPRRSIVVLVALTGLNCALASTAARAQDAGVPSAPPHSTPPPSAAPRLHPVTPEEAAADASLTTAVPTDWLSEGARRCVRRGALRGKCDGPRRVPRPSGPDAARATTLGLGVTGTATHLLLGAPEPRWVEAAREGSATPDPADLLFPVAGGDLWRGYGATRRGRRRHNHQGIDIGASSGTPFRSVNDGIVAYADNGLRGYGNLLMVVHPDASTTFYGHCRAIYVFPGQRVRRGQVLGEVGATGFARGEHLHFEWHSGGAGRNPLAHFAALPPGVTPTASQLEERSLPLDRSVFHHPRHRRHGRSPAAPAAPTRPRSRRAP